MLLLRFPISLSAAALALPLWGCSFSDTRVREYVVGAAPVVIVDQTGQEWDITTAVHRWGFDENRFEHGLGVGAIEPLVNPRMIGPGERGYPDDEATFDVIATAIDGQPHAYGRLDITPHEVVDQTIADTPVAVAY